MEAITFFFSSLFEVNHVDIKYVNEFSGKEQFFTFNSFWFDLYEGTDISYYGKHVPEAVVSGVGNYPMFHYNTLDSYFISGFADIAVSTSEYQNGRQFISFFHYKKPGEDDIEANFSDSWSNVLQSSSVPEAEPYVSYSFEGYIEHRFILPQGTLSEYRRAEPYYYYKKPSSDDGQENTASSIEGWKLRETQLFWHYVYPAANLIFKAGDTAGSWKLRETQLFWHYVYQAANLNFKAGDTVGSGKFAYFDIYYVGKYQGTNVPDAKQLDAQLSEYFGSEQIYVMYFKGINSPNFGESGPISSTQSFVVKTPYMENDYGGYNFRTIAYQEIAEGDSLEGTPGVHAAFWAKESTSLLDSQVENGKRNNEATAVSYLVAFNLATTRNLQFKLNVNSEIGLHYKAFVKHYYVSNIVADRGQL